MPPPDTVLGAALMEGFRASGLSPARNGGYGFARGSDESCSTGRFLTIFPTSALRFSTKQAEIMVLPIKLPMEPVPVGIVTLKNRTLAPIVQVVIGNAREVAKFLVKRNVR